MRLGVLGGTFNPIHFGHLRAAEEVRQRVGLDRVLFVPSGTPPLKDTELAPAGDRLRMVELATASNPAFGVSGVEVERSGPSFTVDTIDRLSTQYPTDELFFIFGSDAFADLPKWHKPAEIVSRVHIIIVGRPPEGFAVLERSPFLHLDADKLQQMATGSTLYETRTTGNMQAVLLTFPPLDISATAIRAMVRKGESITYLLPGEVELFIMSHGLYLDG